MFTDSANQQLYAFDAMAGKFTGALYVNSSIPVIELDPVTSAGPVNFTSALDLTWCGAVLTFNGVNPIYANNGNSGLWTLVEQPPSVAITPQSSAAASISLSPSVGYSRHFCHIVWRRILTLLTDNNYIQREHCSYNYSECLWRDSV